MTNMLNAMSHTSRRGDGLRLSSAKVVLLVNMIPPYRLPVFEALAQRVGQLLVWISTPMEPDRQWQPEWGLLNVEVQRSLTLRQSTQHPHGHMPDADVVFENKNGFGAAARFLAARLLVGRRRRR